MHLRAHRMLFSDFGSIPETYPNPTSSKPWAISLAFWSKSADFEPFQIHPKSYDQHSRKLKEIHLRAHWMLFRVFGTIPEPYPNPLFLKPWAIYSTGFLVKIGQFRTLRNSSEIFTNNLESSWKSICEHIGCFSGILDRFPKLIQIRHVQNHGL